MADYYVWSGATGGATGANWANAYLTLQSATSGKAGGDVFYIAHDHVQTQASALSINFPTADTAPTRAYCVNRAGSVPPVSADLRTTAQISTTGASNLSIGGSCSELYGVIFSAGDAANNASLNVSSTSNRTVRLNSCHLKLNNTSSISRLAAGSGGSAVAAILENTTVQFGHFQQALNALGRCVWRNTPNAIHPSSTIPAVLFNFSAGSWFVEGVDLSGIPAPNSLLPSSFTGSNMYAVLKDCKLAPNVTVCTPAATFGGIDATMIRCDSGDINYRTERWTYGGSMSTETTIVRSGGATDGTTPISWKLVTSANCNWGLPLECLPIVVWNETVGAPVTITIQGIWGGGAVPNNDEMWIEVQYFGTSGVPIGSKATSGKANGLAVPAALPAGSGTWGGSTTKFAMSVTITPQEKGPFTIYVKSGKLSSTFYIDPKPVIT